MFSKKLMKYDCMTSQETWQKRACAQVSLEYLILLAAFFSALAIIIPSISFASEQILFAQDTLLAKEITQVVREQVSLFSFLADGSEKTFEFFPAKKIIVSCSQNSLSVSSPQKEFVVDAQCSEFFFSSEFTKKFSLSVKKISGKTLLSFE
jgi:hypothetical protein